MTVAVGQEPDCFRQVHFVIIHILIWQMRVAFQTSRRILLLPQLCS
jgi:hypothetical protein